MEAVVRDIAVRERAIRILDLARSSIMRKVMPYTLAHMRRILPALTMDRYHDAELTEDYKIRVWDERAGAWKSKNIFSGGTRDQFSLALRLAFAIATLPQERGSAPSFIFLDEPLSSFDAERSAALLYLLTQGEVAEAFDQILVISHSNSPAADGFQYRVHLEAGRVSEPTSEELRAADDALLLDSQSVLSDAASD
jgi:exonuclease SbcC